MYKAQLCLDRLCTEPQVPSRMVGIISAELLACTQLVAMKLAADR